MRSPSGQIWPRLDRPISQSALRKGPLQPSESFATCCHDQFVGSIAAASLVDHADNTDLPVLFQPVWTPGPAAVSAALYHMTFRRRAASGRADDAMSPTRIFNGQEKNAAVPLHFRPAAKFHQFRDRSARFSPSPRQP